MILRILTLCAGITGAAVTSQFPEYSQQYAQRLGGAVDALGEVVADFDASALAVGMTRVEALDQMRGTAFLDRRRVDMSATIARHDRLSAGLAALEGKGPFLRAYHLRHFGDTQIARATWAAFQPALPLNFAGGVFAVLGFVLSGGILKALGAALRWPRAGNVA